MRSRTRGHIIFRLQVVLLLLVGWACGLMAQNQAIDKPVSYVAKDSILLMHNGVAHLHGEGQVNYGTMQLNSEYIRVTMDSSLVFAHGVYDTINEEWKGKPVFKDGGDEYESDQMNYNLKTKKGYIRNVVTHKAKVILWRIRRRK